jgi:hypothetical protein
MATGQSWRERDFRTDVPQRRRLLERRTVAVLTLVVAFVVFLLAIQHQTTSCDQDCFDTGVRTHQSGHSWTSYDGAWQWQAQYLLAIGAFAVAIAAVVLAGRYTKRRVAAVLVVAALALDALWGAWVALQPPIAT